MSLVCRWLRGATFGAFLFHGSTAVAEPVPLDVYGDLPGIEQVAISPSGGGLAIIGRAQGQRQLIVLDQQRQPRATASVGDLKIRDLQWVGEDAVMVVNSATQSLGPMFTAQLYEFTGALIVPLDGSKPWMVFDRSQTIGKTIRGQYGIRLVGDKWQGFFGGIELDLRKTGPEFVNGAPSLYAVDMRSNSARKIADAADSRFRTWRIDGHGRVAATLEVTGNGRWQVENARGLVLASGVDPTGDIGLIGLGKDGSTIIYAVEDDRDGERRYFEVPLAGGVPNEILSGVGIDALYFDRTNGQLLGYLESGTPPKPFFFDPVRQAAARKILKAFPKLNVTIADWTPNFSHLLVHTAGNGDSGSWYVVDMAKLKADIVGNDRPLLVPERVGPISTVAYKAGDGLELDGVLTLPPGREAKNLPVILLPHGGPHSHSEATFDWWAQAFASRGYAVFQPNFRGSTNHDDGFRRAGQGQWGRKMQSDISDGLAELQRQGIVDARRACIVGASYGGYAALAGVTLQQGLYRCAVAVAPVSDLQDLYATEARESGYSKMTWKSLRESLGQPSTFAAVSPRRLANKADAPILLIHGKDDTVVPFKHSDAMAGALRSAGKPHQLVVLKGEDHWLSRAETRKQMLEAAVRFVVQHNPPD